MADDRIRVLIIEDNPGDAKYIEIMLANSKGSVFELVTADCMSAALKQLEENNFDVVLSDIGLPDSEGKNTFLKLNERTPDVPIILLTGIDDESFAVQLIKEGAQDYLIKGKFNTELLTRSIHYSMERSRLLQRIRSLTLVDDLTGLYNMRGFKTIAEKQIKLAERLNTGMLIYFIDIDKLKSINDSFGHLEGSAAIMKTANILLETFRESDIIARLGGDEFVVLLLEKSGITSDVLDSRLQDNLDAYNAMNAGRYKISITTGLARYSASDPISLDELLKKADSIMYERKREKQHVANREILNEN